MERKTISANLIIANRELAFQRDEKGKQAKELLLANKELAFQNEEKGKRANELIIANKELDHQNTEKKKRADELIIANKELVFQNEEKEKRADELISYKHFFYNSLDLACFVTPDGYFEELNNSFTKVLGYTKRELKEKKITDLLHPDDVDLTLKRMGDLVSGIETINSTNRYKTKKGSYRYIEWNSVYNHETRKIYSSGRDITEKMIAIKELGFQNEEKEKRAAELVIANKELAFQNVEKENRAAELAIANKELAFQNQEKENRAAELIVANKELSFQNKEKENRAAELIIANKELSYQNEEKENRAAELVIANNELAFQNVEKGIRAEELIIANKELKKAEDDIRKFNEELEQKVIERTAQLEAVNNELGSFSYSVSHDLRAPIRAINGYAKILEDDYAEKFDPEGISALHAITQNSKRMGQLIDDLLTFSKLGRKEVSVSDINMAALVGSVKNDLLSGERERRIKFKINLIPPARGDQSLIKQVWINLISNAIKYSKYKAKTHIEIGAYEKDDLVIYYVKDNGAGFEMQYYDKLFGVFQRLHSQEEFEGTGIGLAIVQKIIQRHNGTVWARSKLNEETVFYFSLPNVNS